MEWIASNTGLWLSVAGALGLLVGSFLNVLIKRLPTYCLYHWKQEAKAFLEETAPTWLNPSSTPSEKAPPSPLLTPSHCLHCKTPIRFYDNIPLLSFCLLKGRCRACQQKIDWQYPLVEFISLLLTVWVAAHFGFGLKAFAAMFLTWVLIAQTGIDYKHQLLLDDLSLPTLWIGLLLSLIPLFVSPQAAILGAVCGYLTFFILFWAFKFCTGKDALGQGDFKLLALLGAWLGVKALPAIILLSSLLGSLVGLSLILLGKHNRDAPMPFGPYLAMAGFFSLLFNDRFLIWWLG